jgi:dihydrofolate synthase/folylpolyglutamate synthase
VTGPALPTYRRAVEALAERGRFGIRLGLGRTRALLRAMGDPQLAVKGALVGGTNGKGSVLALAGSVLREAGYRVGETPKPHLVTYRERLQIGGRPIEPVAFARLVDDILPIASRLAPRYGEPTEFELLTAMLFRWFAEESVDLALVEVGLGGRLDATNAWDGGVAAITNVDLDHTEWLGPTVEAIAREKAAIIKRGDVAITGALEPALTVIRRRAARVSVPLRVVAPPPSVEVARDGLIIGNPALGTIRVGLRGRHQAANFAVADAVLDALAETGIAPTTVAQRATGYEHARWPGRLELLTVGGLEVLLDGAHNPAGAAALAAALDDLRPFLGRGTVTLVTATMADKDVDGVIGALAAARALDGARVIATTVAGPRALPADALAARWRALSPNASVTAIDAAGSAVDAALEGAAGPVVIAGSLYLVGVARARLVDDPLLRDPRDEDR